MLAAVVSLATACGEDPEPVETTVDAAAANISRLQDDLAVVADRQDAAADALDLALGTVRAVDRAVPLLADEATLDEGLDAIAVLSADLDVADPEAARPVIREVAFAVDRARVSLRLARESLSEVPEDVAYLDATDAVLAEVRGLSAAQDALAQVVDRHLAVYRDLRDVVVDFASRRGRFRSAAEATDAFSVEARRQLRDLDLAQQDIAEFAARRVDAAREVNAAQAEAARAFRARGEASS